MKQIEIKQENYGKILTNWEELYFTKETKVAVAMQIATQEMLSDETKYTGGQYETYVFPIINRTFRQIDDFELDETYEEKEFDLELLKEQVLKIVNYTFESEITFKHLQKTKMFDIETIFAKAIADSFKKLYNI